MLRSFNQAGKIFFSSLPLTSSPSSSLSTLSFSFCFSSFSSAATSSISKSTLAVTTSKPQLAASGILRHSSSQTPRIAAAAVIERVPVLLPELHDWEHEWMEFQGRQEARKSAQLPDSLINHTLRKVYDDQGNEITEREPLPKITKDDEADNRKSLYRKLAEPLYLIVKKPKEMEMPWQFPTAYHQGDQTIRQTAEKGLKASCGEDLMTYFLGNAPVAHLNLKTEKGDTQLFLHHSLWTYGKVRIDDKDVTDYAWVTKAQLYEYIQNKELLQICEKSFYY